MTEQAMLLKAIVDQPEEDTLRLVYADWLDENDQANHAEFIRKQIDYSKPPPIKPKCSPFGVMLRTTIPILGAVSSTKDFKEYKAALSQWNHDHAVYKSLPEQIHKLWCEKTWSSAPDEFVYMRNTPTTHHTEYWEYKQNREQFAITYYRGFPDSLSSTIHGFMKCGKLILSLNPINRFKILYKHPKSNIGEAHWTIENTTSPLDLIFPGPMNREHRLPHTIFNLLPTSEQFGFIKNTTDFSRKRYINTNFAIAALNAACMSYTKL
jgi:uncharacterized protein (TIGR02996 family)